ncbi:3-keto-5-aminohexanoate cleavage protein [Pseudonocardia sp. WMMC193]|uniref:3-keto-5-aminohexanoate cleavage protein n=1 Tax=Pseudonocardia sp. WMMC193 TaxID=2911965 RepID=UPI001F1D3E0A|nr:3-keto-5-aminohexanoate cleavage protein [Pseudonocardia sp. WMMC193]MCF7547895.1 3-keto-5-aminohexanoate cleavage protein [Pseudonocardia sp. WMMC193]
MSRRPVIVTIAPTGGFLTPDRHPHVPVTPEAIAADVARCAEAGASMAALHARTADGAATCDPEVYRATNALVRGRCDVVVNNSTGGGVTGAMRRETEAGPVVDEEMRLSALASGADTFTLDTITSYVDGPDGEVLMGTSRRLARALAEGIAKAGATPEWEVFNHANLLVDLPALADLDSAPHVVNLVLNQHQLFQNALPYSPAVLRGLIAALPPGAVFATTVCGPDPTPALADTLLLGGHVRVGIEDSPFATDGRPRTNLEQVHDAVELVRAHGCEPATPEQARELLGIGS